MTQNETEITTPAFVHPENPKNIILELPGYKKRFKDATVKKSGLQTIN